MRPGNDRVIEASAKIFREVEGRRFRESFGTSEASGAHAPGGLELENLHVEAAGAKAELEHSADVAVAFRVVGPSGGKAFTRGQRLIGFIN